MDKNEENANWWHASRDLWRKGGVTEFLEDQIAELKDANGVALPDHAKQFLIDVFYLRIKAPAKTRKFLYSEHVVRQAFQTRLCFNRKKKKFSDPSTQTSQTPKDAALQDTAEALEISESIVSEIIYSRSSRKKK